MAKTIGGGGSGEWAKNHKFPSISGKKMIKNRKSPSIYGLNAILGVDYERTLSPDFILQ